MVKVIETNILYPNGEMADFQSRVIEVESWDDLVDEVKLNKTVARSSFLGHMDGVTLPRGCKTINHASDNHHLSCKVVRYDGSTSLKLLYLIE